MSGRFAPSPTAPFHLGNLRTAAIAWLSARAAGKRFLLRIEDIDRERSKTDHERSQLADLAAIGLDWDGEVVRQSERRPRYDAAIEQLRAAGRVYECFCTRREIRAEIEASPSAPHGLRDAYPGTCRDLARAERDERRAGGREPALRLRTEGERIDFHDLLRGPTDGPVDDLVLRRNDGTPAYNLAVVVDDAEQGITEVVRGDDLFDSTPRQVLIQRLLGYPTPEYLHVPLVIDAEGRRLAKRDGDATLAGLRAMGVPATSVVDWIVSTLGVGIDVSGGHMGLGDLIATFDVAMIGGDPVPVPAITAG